MAVSNNNHKFDLHTHSSYSDGTTAPAQIAAEAANTGLTGFALTDHDTMQGWSEAREAAELHGLEFLPGIELTTHERGRSIHLLAYGPDPLNERLIAELSALRNARQERAQKMVDLLSRDFELDWSSVLTDGDGTGTQSPGRPHLADALVLAGYFSDRGDAFKKALHPGGPYYIPTRELGTTEAIEIVDAAGGFAVLAHPAAFRMKRPIQPEIIKSLSKKGLRGIEVHHPENLDEHKPLLIELANELGLLVTGSSDYHGAGKPNRLGECTSDLQTLTEIRSQVATPR